MINAEASRREALRDMVEAALEAERVAAAAEAERVKLLDEVRAALQAGDDRAALLLMRRYLGLSTMGIAA